eukprot:scaffold2203_cov202-Prasinococcus_capsulatus_cf.AAC.1
MKPGERPVAEEVRIEITEALENFQKSDLTEFTFEESLSNHDRAVVHSECKRYGFTSKSYGKGENRKVTVFKNRAQQHGKLVLEEPVALSCSTTSSMVLSDYLRRFPATKAERNAAGGESDK